MPVSARIEIRFNHLPRISAELTPKATREVRTALLNIERSAKERVPVVTGALRRSIVTKMLGALSGEVGPSVIYGARVEFGFNGPDRLGRVYHQAGQPYLVPAAEAERPKFLAAMAKIANP